MKYDLDKDKRLSEKEMNQLADNEQITKDESDLVERNDKNLVTLRSLSKAYGMDCKSNAFQLKDCESIDKFLGMVNEGNTSSVTYKAMQKH
jgi:hypothetical protein